VKRPASLRVLAAIALTVGIVVGTIADRAPRRSPQQSGEYFILSADFHVHAAPGDGSLTPSALRDEAVRAGLDVIAITNHNQFVAARLASSLSGQADEPIVIPGEEVTHPDYHLIAVGLEHPVKADGAVIDVAAKIHEQGGVAIAAHPTHAFTGYDDAALAAVDGTEVAHPERLEKYRREYVKTFERARRLKPHIAPIGSSDFHNTPALGQCRTFVFVRERSAAGVLEALRAGRTVALDDHRNLYGDPSLVERVRRAQPVGRTDVNASWRRLAVLLSWCGLAGLLVL
jgi:hypothetical protein